MPFIPSANTQRNRFWHNATESTIDMKWIHIVKYGLARRTGAFPKITNS